MTPQKTQQSAGDERTGSIATFQLKLKNKSVRISRMIEIVPINSKQFDYADNQESDGYIEDRKKECAKIESSSLKSLIKKELSSVDQLTNQIHNMTREFSKIKINEKKARLKEERQVN